MKPGELTGWITPADPLATAHQSRRQLVAFVPKDAHQRSVKATNLAQLDRWIDHLEAEVDDDAPA